MNGSLECGPSCSVIGPDYSIASIFTPLVIGLVAASGVVLLAVGCYCIRSCRRQRSLLMSFLFLLHLTFDSSSGPLYLT